MDDLEEEAQIKELLGPVYILQTVYIRLRLVYAAPADNEEALHHRIADACQAIGNCIGILWNCCGGP
jgi:hypothetical protein